MKRIAFAALAWVIIPALSLFGATAEDIVRAMDQTETFTTSYAVGEIITTDRFGTKTSSFKAWTRGTDESLIEFTSTAEKGQKILRTKGELYLYYPDASQLIRMQGAALRQSLLGSDISYEDMTGEKDTLARYKASLAGTETVSGHSCHILELVATTRTVAYPRMKLWIDTESFIVRKAEYSTQTGRLLKQMEVIETRSIGNRTIPVRTSISDALKKDSRTIMITQEIQIDIPLDSGLFSLENLTW